MGFQNSTSSYPTAFLDFDASLGLPPGHTTDPVTGEFRPWSIYGVSYTITSNGVVNEAALDAAGVMAQVLLLQGRVAALENSPRGLGFNQSYATFTAAQRPAGTWFENLTASPKFVTAIRSAGGNTNWRIDVRIAGVDKTVSVFGANGTTEVVHTLLAVVPPGAFYKLTFFAGSSDYTVQELTS